MVQRIENEPQSSGDLVIPIERVPVAAFQAIYHHLTRATDSLEREYDTPIEVGLGAITDLHYHVTQSVSQYAVKATSSRAVISLSNGEVLSIPSVEKFQSLNLNSFSSFTKSVSIEYDYLIIRPVEITEAENVSQRLKVRVTFTNRSRDEFPVFPGPFGISPRYIVGRGTTSVIEYSDIAIARSLQSVLDEWVARSRLVDDTTISDKVAARWKSISGYSIPVSAVLMLVASIFLEIKRYNNLLTPMRYLLVVLALTISMTVAAALASEKVNEIVSTLRLQGGILLTAGDMLQAKEARNERLKAKARIGHIVLGVVLTFLVGLVVNYVSVKFLPNS